MAIETKFSAKTAMCQISAANTALDGSGTLGTLLTGAANGTLIKSVIIKAITSTSQGCVRIFIYAGGTTNLIYEAFIPAVTKSSVDCAYQKVIPLNQTLQSGCTLKVSTEVANTFNIIAEGLDWEYPTEYTEDTTKYSAYTGIGRVLTANANLDGSGSLAGIARADVGMKGLEISSIKVKSLVNTTTGMIRFYIIGPSSPYDSNFLFHELRVPAVTKSATSASFNAEAILQGSFALQADFQIVASTEKGETFAITLEGANWDYL